MKIWVMQKEPEIDSTVLTAYEAMRDEFPDSDIYPFPDKEYKMLLQGVKETLKLQSYFQCEGTIGSSISGEGYREEEENGLYNPFEGIYRADDDTLLLLNLMHDRLSQNAIRVEPIDTHSYYMAPMPIGWEMTMPFLLSGITTFTEHMVNDLQRGMLWK